MINHLNEQLDKAYNGLSIWRELSKKLSIQPNDFVLLIPNNPKEFSYFSLLYSQTFLKKDMGTTHLLTTNKVVMKAAKYIDLPFQNIHLLSKYECNAILSLYNLYIFTDKLLILSPFLPVGRTGYNLVKNGILDLEEYISIGLLHNRVFQKEPLVTYDGDDEDLIEFFMIKREGELH